MVKYYNIAFNLYFIFEQIVTVSSSYNSEVCLKGWNSVVS